MQILFPEKSYGLIHEERPRQIQVETFISVSQTSLKSSKLGLRLVMWLKSLMSGIVYFLHDHKILDETFSKIRLKQRKIFNVFFLLMM